MKSYIKVLLALLFVFVKSSSLLAATASLTPASKDYGSVTIGSTSTQVFTLTYTGAAAGALTVTSATVSAAPFTKILDGCTGISIPAPGGTCTVTVQYAPTAVSTSTGTLIPVTNATDGTNKISSLLGKGVTGPTVTGSISPDTYDFGSVTISSSSTNTFTITNTGGTVNLTIASATVSAAPFVKTADTCTGASLPALGTCTIEVTYFPTAVTVSLGTLTVVTNATDGTSKISALTGTGVTGPTVTGSITPSTFAFGEVTIGSSSTTTFTITNTGGTVNLTITSATVSAAPFIKTADTCTGASLPIAGTCTIEVTYFPTAVTISLGTLTVVTNATDGTSKISSMTGTGVTGPTVTGSITPSTFAFGEVTIGTLSSNTFTITNTGGTVNLTITSATVSAAPFIKTADTCTGASLPIAGTCTIEVSYFPTTAVSSVAVLTVVTNATDGTSKIASLSGTGIVGASVTGSISPTSHHFGEVDVGSSDSQIFTITNTGGSGNLNITSVAVSGTSFVLTSDGCTSASLANLETCDIDVSFSPTTAGIFSGTVTVVTNATDGSNKIASLNGATSSPGTIEFSSDTFAFNNDIETAIVYVMRTGGTTGNVTVDYTTAPGTASETGGDYEETSGTLTWADGDASPKKIEITIDENSFDEDSRQFLLILSDPTGGAVLGSASIATVDLFEPNQSTSASTDGSSGTVVDNSGCSISRNGRGGSDSLWIMLTGLAIFLMMKRRRLQ